MQDKGKAEKRRRKKEREQKEQAEKLKRSLHIAICKNQIKAFLLNLWDEIGGVLEDDYNGIYSRIMEIEANEYIRDNITEYWEYVDSDWLDNTIWEIITQ